MSDMYPSLAKLGNPAVVPDGVQAVTGITDINLQSLVDTHEQPFVIIDKDYRICAVNCAYEQAYGTGRDWAVGKPCFKISHDNDSPCDTFGEDCPQRHVFETGKTHSCLHIHYDKNHRMHQVRVTAYPLRNTNGELYMGELITEISTPEDRRANGDRMEGGSPKFATCLEQLNLAAASDAPVMLQGETGTGKELAANYIHQHSRRGDKPFMTLDCTVLTETLFEAEVFGHARGAFTGSVGEKPGLFEQANNGVLFLDEIGEMPWTQQAKLLRAIETGKYRRVGGRKDRTTDIRIICATNCHLWDAVRGGNFREDLYYRVACLSIRMPSLRERLEDIPVLTHNLLERVNRTMQRSYGLTADALEQLQDYHYPGNIRELRNILFVAATRCPNGEITRELIADVIKHLASMHAKHPDAAAEKTPGIAVAADSLHDVEAEHIAKLLCRFSGNRKQVAAHLQVSERTLYRKLKRYDLA